MIVERAAAGLPNNPHGQGQANVAIIMCVIAGFLVICRLLVRVLIHHQTGWDDYTLIGSLMLAIGMTICFNMEVWYGMGLHTKQLTNKHYKVLAFTWLWVAQLLYKFANGLTKISIVLLYLRIFPTRRFRIAAWAAISYVCAYCTVAICTSIWQCKPIAKAWEKQRPGKCIDIGNLWYANSVLTIVADLILIAMPMHQILKLQLPLSQKLGLVFVFSLGVFVMACTIIRCVMLGRTTSSKDSVYYQAKSNSWTLLEVDVSIICASLPILKLPLQRLLPRLFGTLKSKGQSQGYMRSPDDLDSHGQSQKFSSLKDGSQQQVIVSSNGSFKSDSVSHQQQMLEDQGSIIKTSNVTLDYEEIEMDKDPAQTELASSGTRVAVWGSTS